MSAMNKLTKKTRQVISAASDTIRQAFRAKIKLVNSSDSISKIQVTGLADETLQDIELIQHFGFTSHPPVDTDAIVIPLGGMTSHGIVIATENGHYRLKSLKQGEVSIYNQDGAFITLKQGKIIEVDCETYRVNCNQYEVNAGSGANFNTPTVTASAVLTAEGTINGNGGMAISGGSGASFNGDINQNSGSYVTNGDVVASGKSLTNHIHNGDSGGTTSPPL